jgi:hypothetical protein
MNFCYFDNLAIVYASEIVFNIKLLVVVGEKLYFYTIFMGYLTIQNVKIRFESFGVWLTNIKNVNDLSVSLLCLIH